MLRVNNKREGYIRRYVINKEWRLDAMKALGYTSVEGSENEGMILVEMSEEIYNQRMKQKAEYLDKVCAPPIKAGEPADFTPIYIPPAEIPGTFFGKVKQQVETKVKQQLKKVKRLLTYFFPETMLSRKEKILMLFLQQNGITEKEILRGI